MGIFPFMWKELGKLMSALEKKNLYFVHATNCPLTVVASYADTIKLPSMGAAREVSLYKTMEHFLVAGVITCHMNLEFDKLT